MRCTISVLNVLNNPSSQANDVAVWHNVHRVGNVNGGDLKLLGKAEVAVGLQLFLPKHVVGLLMDKVFRTPIL